MDMSTADRHFIIARQGQSVVIREVCDGASDLTFTRADAWSLAQRMAKPAKSAKDPRAKAANQIEFLDLGGMSTIVQTFEATQDAYEAELRGEKPAPVATPAPATTPEANTADVPEWAWLRTQDTAANAFLHSLKGQLERKGTLSEKQTACITKAMQAEQARSEAQEAHKPAMPHNVPAGRYAVENADGKLSFYKVDTPTEGKWAGFTFLKVLASDTEYPVKGAGKATILAAIAVDPKAALIRYGREIGACGVCNRTLTDEASREAGIGPVCAANGGY